MKASLHDIHYRNNIVGAIDDTQSMLVYVLFAVLYSFNGFIYGTILEISVLQYIIYGQFIVMSKLKPSFGS